MDVPFCRYRETRVVHSGAGRGSALELVCTNRVKHGLSGFSPTITDSVVCYDCTDYELEEPLDVEY